MVLRAVYAEVPPKVEYAFTDFGRSLEPTLLLMRTWGEPYTNQLVQQKQAQTADRAPVDTASSPNNEL